MAEMRRKRSIPQRFEVGQNERQVSSRGVHAPEIPGLNEPGMPQNLQGQPGVVISPDVIKTLADQIAHGIWQALDRFSVTVTSPPLTLTTANQTLAASVTANGSVNFNLTYAAPTDDSKGAGVAQGFTITLTASTP